MNIQQPQGGPSPDRDRDRASEPVLAACGESVVCVDLATGRHVGTVNVG